MSHAGHFIERCDCGAVIAQCRCFDKNKPERIVERGCKMCQNEGRYVVSPEFALHGAGQTMVAEKDLVASIKEAIRLSPTGTVQVRAE